MDDVNRLLDELVEAAGATPDKALTLEEIVYRLLAATVIGWLIGSVYRRTFTGRKISPTLPDTHILLCIGGALIWLVVGNNVVRAFGLAGTIALIRYRTVVRDPKDTPIILFSMVMGMACGLGQFKIAIVGTIVVIGVLFLLYRSHRKNQLTGEQRDKQLIDLVRGESESGDKRSPPS